MRKQLQATFNNKIALMAFLICVYGIIDFFASVYFLETTLLIEFFDGEWIGVFVSGIALYYVNDVIHKSKGEETLRQQFGALQTNTMSLIKTEEDLKNIDLNKVGNLFYDKLFSRSEEVRVMFKGRDLAEQKKILMGMMHFLVTKSADKTIVEDLIKLGKRHIGYGVKVEHYKLFEVCFAEALEEAGAKHIYEWKMIIRMYVSVIISTYPSSDSPPPTP